MKRIKFLRITKNFCKKHWRKWMVLAILVTITYISLVFYQYIYKPLYEPKESTSLKLEIKKKTHKEVMDLYSQRQGDLDKALRKDYPNPFK